jgi:four helix bundle protein
MATVRNFEELDVWNVSRILSEKIIELIRAGRFDNNFALIDQLRRSSGSVMDNIAEGFERGSKAEFLVFLGYAKGSCGELRSQLQRVKMNNYVDKGEFEELNDLAVQIGKMLYGLIRYLQRSTYSGIRKKM